MKHPSRPLSILALSLVLGGILFTVPGSVQVAADAASGSSLTIGAILRDFFDPIVFALAFLAAFLAGGVRGFGNALLHALGRSTAPESRAAAAGALSFGARTWLWSLCLLNVAAIVSFYWPEPPTESLGFLPRRMLSVKVGAFPVAAFALLFLLPQAETLRKPRPGVADWLDVTALFGLVGCVLVLLLAVLVYQAPVIGEEPPSRMISPTFDTLGPAFLAWSVVVPLVLSALALLQVGLGSATPRSILRGALAAGVVAAIAVEAQGMNEIATTGGQGDSVPLQSLAGRMLVALGCALLVGLALIAARARSGRAATLEARGATA